MPKRTNGLQKIGQLMGLRPKAVLGVGLALAALLGTLVYWQDIRSSATESLAASGKAARRTISASVEPASSVRCNRISLPKQYYNATTAPYNPAAMQHPATNEWFLLHTFDEVRPPMHADAARSSRALHRATRRTL